jgi:hypothetical protein
LENNYLTTVTVAVYKTPNSGTAPEPTPPAKAGGFSVFGPRQFKGKPCAKNKSALALTGHLLANEDRGEAEIALKRINDAEPRSTASRMLMHRSRPHIRRVRMTRDWASKVEGNK